jgi:predicted Zn-dependent protease
MKNLKFFLLFFVAIILTAIVIVSCQKDEIITPQESQVLFSGMNLNPLLSGINDTPFGIMAQKKLSAGEYKQILSEINFIFNGGENSQDLYKDFVNNPIDNWFDLGNDAGYNVDSDIVMSRAAVQNMMKNISSKNARHILNLYIASKGTKNIRVHKNVPTDWRTAITQAATAWNDLGYGIKFTVSYTNSTTDWYNSSDEVDVYYQDTDIRGKTFDYLRYAETYMPQSNGKIGEIMNINSKHSTSAPGCKKMVIAHELGHAIGVYHTDVSYPINTYTEVNVPGCGPGFTDATSIMSKGDWMYDNIPWQGFTPCDKAVIAKYWPK